jgi:alkylated DNA repair dioxygenase AlkB
VGRDAATGAARSIRGLYLVRDFITEGEEAQLLRDLCGGEAVERVTRPSGRWHTSVWNGECLMQKWGVVSDMRPKSSSATGRTVRLPDPERHANEAHFPPPCLAAITERLVSLWCGSAETEALAFSAAGVAKGHGGWRPNMANANLYRADKGHTLAPHADDRQLSGPVLATLSLRGDASMTFRNEKAERAGSPAVAIKFPMPRRSIQFVCNDARYAWTHGIAREDLPAAGIPRVSVTFREEALSARATGR